MSRFKRTASSNPGDLILDPFCGCGTAVHAAEKLGRKWIGIDITHLAIALIQNRMRNAFPESSFEVNGTPKDVESARFLATTNGLEGRYQFQYWTLSLVNGIPAQDKKKGADKGQDGYIWAYSHPNEKPFKINISVKSGKIPANHIRELGGLLGRNCVEICALLTLENPSRAMLADALSYGYFEYHGHKFQRVQILSIAELLQGRKIDYLDLGDGRAMPKKAKLELKEQEQYNLDKGN